MCRNPPAIRITLTLPLPPRLSSTFSFRFTTSRHVEIWNFKNTIQFAGLMLLIPAKELRLFVEYQIDYHISSI